MSALAIEIPLIIGGVLALVGAITYYNMPSSNPDSNPDSIPDSIPDSNPDENNVAPPKKKMSREEINKYRQNLINNHNNSKVFYSDEDFKLVEPNPNKLTFGPDVKQQGGKKKSRKNKKSRRSRRSRRGRNS